MAQPLYRRPHEAELRLPSFALKKLPLSVSYAVWTGIGIAGTAVLGVFLFGEAMNAQKAVCIALILAGIAGLRLCQ